MARRVAYLSEEAIERDAELLLAGFAARRGVVIKAPVPIDDIVEKFLKLGIEFDDLHRHFDVPRRSGDTPDILGAILLDERKILIDESLDPDRNPASEGRYRFTLAHEGCGHWRLHRDQFLSQSGQASLFGDPPSPTVICRSSQERERIEWQADFYAACVLMPRKLIHEAWNETFPDGGPRVLPLGVPAVPPYVELRRIEWGIADSNWSETDAQMLDRVAKPLAKRFLVSTSAMRIRLEHLGLLHSQMPLQHAW